MIAVWSPPNCIKVKLSYKKYNLGWELLFELGILYYFLLELKVPIIFGGSNLYPEAVKQFVLM